MIQFLLEATDSDIQKFLKELEIESDRHAANQFQAQCDNLFTRRKLKYNVYSQTRNVPIEFVNEARTQIFEAISPYRAELSDDELHQLIKYLYIFEIYDLTLHWEVNEVITQNNDWDSFKAIRSKNNHGHKLLVDGITPKYFAIVCTIIEQEIFTGNPLLSYRRY